MKVVSIITLLFTSVVLANSHINELSFLETKATDNVGCWLSATGRGIGKAIHTCKAGLEQSGLLCYPKCEQNFTGAGPVCWQNCPSGNRDDGAFCFKNAAYGRGAGYFTQEKCQSQNSIGCEKNGLLYYPKCQDGYKNVGCCICSPVCVNGMTDIGISCAKQSYGRGVGSPLTCSENEEYDAGLCYPQCKSGTGIGPVCWGSCPSGYAQCGALCLKGETCADQIKQYVNGVEDIIKAFASKNYTEGIIDILEFTKELIYPICN